MANLNAGKGPQRTEQATEAVALAQPLAEAVAECGEAYTKGFAEIQDEVTRFAQARMQRNSELAEALARCRDINDMMGLQQEWLKAASQDYLQQTARMMGIASRMTQDWMQPMTKLWGNGTFVPDQPRAAPKTKG
ncbi:MAG TPA: phasin family protein [Kiloniellales bacterium]|nr:phasin family protein [Kiloniellales bacterium]